MNKRRIRVQGTIVARGDGYTGRYRNVWLHIRTPAHTTIQVTASPESKLGNAPVGAPVALALTLTGLIDLSKGLYFGSRARVLYLDAPPLTRPSTT